jgi:hypothetical protein
MRTMVRSNQPPRTLHCSVVEHVGRTEQGLVDIGRNDRGASADHSSVENAQEAVLTLLGSNAPEAGLLR